MKKINKKTDGFFKRNKKKLAIAGGSVAALGALAIVAPVTACVIAVHAITLGACAMAGPSDEEFTKHYYEHYWMYNNDQW
mgnify:CR=1 FL=1